MDKTWDRERDTFRCKGRMSVGGVRCYFNVQPGSEHCPGHQGDAEGACNTKALGEYQLKFGVDYPCGKPDDVHRVFDPDAYKTINEVSRAYDHRESEDDGVSLFKEGQGPVTDTMAKIDTSSKPLSPGDLERMLKPKKSPKKLED